MGTPLICCAVSLINFVHASAVLLGWTKSGSVCLDLEIAWLESLTLSWIVADELLIKAESLKSSFELFASTQDAINPGEAHDLVICAANDFGLELSGNSM